MIHLPETSQEVICGSPLFLDAYRQLIKEEPLRWDMPILSLGNRFRGVFRLSDWFNCVEKSLKW